MIRSWLRAAASTDVEEFFTKARVSAHDKTDRSCEFKA